MTTTRAQIGPTPSTALDNSSRRADIDTQARDLALNGRVLTAKIANGETAKLPHGFQSAPSGAFAQIIGLDGVAHVIAIGERTITVLLDGATDTRSVRVLVIE